MNYQITSIDEDLMPLQRNIKGSLEHLKKFNKVIKQRGQTIIKKVRTKLKTERKLMNFISVNRKSKSILID